MDTSVVMASLRRLHCPKIHKDRNEKESRKRKKDKKYPGVVGPGLFKSPAGLRKAAHGTERIGVSLVTGQMHSSKRQAGPVGCKYSNL